MPLWLMFAWPMLSWIYLGRIHLLSLSEKSEFRSKVYYGQIQVREDYEQGIVRFALILLALGNWAVEKYWVWQAFSWFCILVPTMGFDLQIVLHKCCLRQVEKSEPALEATPQWNYACFQGTVRMQQAGPRGLGGCFLVLHGWSSLVPLVQSVRSLCLPTELEKLVSRCVLFRLLRLVCEHLMIFDVWDHFVSFN